MLALQLPGPAAEQAAVLARVPGLQMVQQQQRLGDAAVLALQLPGPAAEQAAVLARVPGLQRVQVRLLQLWPSLQKHREMSVGRVC